MSWWVAWCVVINIWMIGWCGFVWIGWISSGEVLLRLGSLLCILVSWMDEFLFLPLRLHLARYDYLIRQFVNVEYHLAFRFYHPLVRKVYPVSPAGPIVSYEVSW